MTPDTMTAKQRSAALYRERHREELRKREREKRAADPEGYRARRTAATTKWRLTNPESSRKACRKWYRQQEERRHERRLEEQYGMTLGQYTEMLAAQNGKCAIC